MKLKVLKQFYDKDTLKPFRPGGIVEWEDEERISNCISRGLVEPADQEERPKPKKTTKKK